MGEGAGNRRLYSKSLHSQYDTLLLQHATALGNSGLLLSVSLEHRSSASDFGIFLLNSSIIKENRSHSSIFSNLVVSHLV